MNISIIAAVAKDGVIGKGGGIPWYYSEDLKHFRLETIGNPVILGRKTFENIQYRMDGPLPDRMNIVLSESMEASDGDYFVARDVDHALELSQLHSSDTVYVAGGESVYESFLDRADELVLTEIERRYDGDSYFPEWPIGDSWTEVDREKRAEFDFAYYKYDE